VAKLFFTGFLTGFIACGAMIVLRHYDSYHHMAPEHNHLVRDEWVDRFGHGGTPDHVREKVREFIASGNDEFTIVPCGESKKATWKASHEM
jgi:alkanesulfonate monooxygenase SsuD/methylene tetrahydromethanopterin reductase-like flavin-dependent oxidoreductase (luciferase family)